MGETWWGLGDEEGQPGGWPEECRSGSIAPRGDLLQGLI